MTQQSARITTTDMSVSINGNQLLAPINLTINAGEWVGIVGPNGGGKSTFVKALMGQIPHQGVITLEWPKGHKGKLGYVPQLAPFEPSLPVTVLDYLRMVCENRPVWFSYKQNKKIAQTMARFEISEFSNKRLGTLSAGERQRVMLCGALVNNPDILMLDEPLAGVDKQGHQLILDILEQFHRQGKTIVMVEHHWHVIEQYCQKVALIDGKLCQFGDAQAVFNAMKSHVSPFELAKSA